MTLKTKSGKVVENPCDGEQGCKTLVIGETEYITRLNKKFLNRKNWEAPDPRKVFSYIPGTILKIFVEKGKVYSKGDPLVILEAMKMRNEVVMPMDGEIESIGVSEGQRVPKGHLIVSLK